MCVGSSKPRNIPTKWYDKFVEEELPKSLEGQVVVITGCTTGTGLVFAKTVAKKNVSKLFMLNRSSERAESAQAAVEEVIKENESTTEVLTVNCDLQSFESVRSAAEVIASKTEAVDVLCCNAGVMAMDDEATVDGFDVQMQTNHLSHFLLTKELFPLLSKAADLRGQARVVSMSSNARDQGGPLEEKYLGKNGGNLGGNKAFLFKGAKFARYQQSKLANVVFTSALSERLKAANSKVIATSACPGFAATNLQVTAARSGSMGPVSMMIMYMAQSAEDGTMGLLKASFMPVESGDCYEPSGSGRATGPPVKFPLDEKATKKESCDMLWSASEAACGEFKI